MEKSRGVWKKLLTRKAFFEEKDVTQNIFSARCFLLIMLFYTLVIVLNAAGIFIVDHRIFRAGYFSSLFIAVVYFIGLSCIGLEHPAVKYMNILVMAVLVTIAGVTLTYHTVVIIMVPIIMSSMYTEKRVSLYAYFLTLISIVVSTYAGYYYGVCDANMVLLTSTSMKNLVKDGEFLITEINTAPGKTLFWYFILPRIFLATAFYLICANVYHMIEHSMENAVKMKRQAYMDDMTGLYNKNCLLEVIENKTLQNEQIAVIYWDVNRLKYVNDHFGHIAGDILIKKVGCSIKNVCPENAKAYRYGGDEFIMLIENAKADDAKQVIGRFEMELEKAGQDCEYPVSAAVGTVTGSGAELEKLISQADRQMYANKMVHRE